MRILLNIKIILILLLCCQSAQSQIDSLLNVIERAEEDSAKIDLLVQVGWIIHPEDPDSALVYANRAEPLALKIRDPQRAADVYKLKAFCYGDMNDRPNCLQNHLYRLDALNLMEEQTAELAGAYFETGAVLKSQKQLASAEDYFNKAVEVAKEVESKGAYGMSLISLSEIKSGRGEHQAAIKDLKLAVKVLVDYTPLHQAYAMSNLANTYLNVDSLDQAERVLDSALIITEQFEEPEIEGFVFEAVAITADRKGDFKKSKTYFNKALNCWEPMNKYFYLQSLYLYLGNVHDTLGTDSAAYYYKKHIELRDQANNEDNNEKVAEMEAKFKNAEKEKQIAVLNKENDLAALENKRQMQVNWLISSGLVIVVLFLFFLVNRMRLIRKQKDLIHKQKQIVEEKSNEITDSIVYAKRIQTAILPSDRLMKEQLSDHFVLYEPKDIVAGDFYWMQSTDQGVLLAAADCTGHGVPGAMVSVICNNGLNRSVREYGLKQPAAILDKTREIVIEEFIQGEVDVKDGMDIAICAIEGHKIKYAGAHNPLWIIRKNSNQIEEIKADKQPIGHFENAKPFTHYEIDLASGDQCYIFSDGYADQFGGEKGKKFKAANLKDLLLAHKEKSMNVQKTLLLEHFEEWKGSLEQLDDVCIIGFRL